MGVLLERFFRPLNQTLQLSPIGHHVNIVLIMLNESLHKISPRMNMSGLELNIPLQGSPSKTILEEMHQKTLILRVYRHLTIISLDMSHRASRPIVFVKRWHFEFRWNPHTRNQPQVIDIHA